MTSIILPGTDLQAFTEDAKRKAALERVAKILTDTEGETTAEKNQEIFETIFGISAVRNDLNSFFKKEHAPIKDILTQWIEARGLVDVLELQHQKIHWCISVRAARIPKKFWDESTPEDTIKMAGHAVGLQLGKPVHFMYGDLRMFTGASNTGKDTINVAYIFAYKQMMGKYS